MKLANNRGDQWATRFGLIMAMAGNAVGLGNFLRFPGKAAPYGGAFMVPYVIALILLGIPLMWMEWTIGRHGGAYGHGSTPGMFHRMWRHPIAKYLGIFGVLLPAMIGVYYIFIESWSLGYAWKTLRGDYWGVDTREGMRNVFGTYLGEKESGFVSLGLESYIFFLITLGINILVFSRGIQKGIEIVAKYAMPTLVVLGVILAVRVLTLPPVEGRTVSDGLAKVWVIDWSVLSNPSVWIDATGQIFFTLSLGFGMIHTYASYLKRHDDITLNGLSACSTNTFVEVLLGATIVVPVAVIFFGPAVTDEIVAGGTFDIGFFSLPVIFQQLAGGQFFGFLWFLLLFLAGLTSSVAMFTPLLLFLQDELNLDRRKALWMIGIGVFIITQPIVLFSHRGIIDELDNWAGTYLLILFAAIEAVMFAWIFGVKNGWAELHEGADLRVPRFYYFIMQWVTPVYVLGLLVWFVGISPILAWGDSEEMAQTLWGKLFMIGADPANVPYMWLARGIILGVGLLLVWGVWHAWRTHPKFFQEAKENGE